MTLSTGTTFEVDEMREFDLHTHSYDDQVGQRSMGAHIAPRWQGMESKSGKSISVPDDLDEGVNLHI